MQGRVRTLTTFKTGDEVADRYQEHVKQVLTPVLDNPILNAVDFRFTEIQPASASGTPTFALQYRSTGTTWTTVLKLTSGGLISTPSVIVSAPAWTAPTLGNSWVDIGGATEAPSGYYKDLLGIVHIRGEIKNGTIGA